MSLSLGSKPYRCKSGEPLNSTEQELLSPVMAAPTSDFPKPMQSDPAASKKHKAVILMGATGAGKSTFINTVAGSTLAVSASLASCTQSVTSVELALEDSTIIELVDTPGFNDSVRSDLEVLNEIATALQTWNERNIELHGVIYLHRISDIRISGSARKDFATFLKICGEDAMPHVTIVTNMWDSVPLEQGELREAELFKNPLFFKPAIDSGADTYRNDHPPVSIHEILRKAIRPNPIRLLIHKEMLDEDKDLLETTAGAELNKEVAEQRAHHEAELSKINHEYSIAQQQKDAETQEELEEEREMIRKKMGEMEALATQLQEQRAAKTLRKQKSAAKARSPAARIAHSSTGSNLSGHRATAVERYPLTSGPHAPQAKFHVPVSEPPHGTRHADRPPETPAPTYGLLSGLLSLWEAGCRKVVGPPKPTNEEIKQKKEALVQDIMAGLSQSRPVHGSTAGHLMPAASAHQTGRRTGATGREQTLEPPQDRVYHFQSRSTSRRSGSDSNLPTSRRERERSSHHGSIH